MIINIPSYNLNSGQQKTNAPLPTLLYVDPKLLTVPEKEELSLVFKFVKNAVNDSVCTRIFTPDKKEFPCLIERKGGTRYLTVWNNHPSSYSPNNRLIGARSYTEFIVAVLRWLYKEHPNLFELLNKDPLANNLPIQSLINSKCNENQLQDQSSTGHRSNPRGSIIDGGRAEASITIKPLSNKAIFS